MPQKALPLDEWNHLFGPSATAHWPESSSTSARHDHGVPHDVQGSEASGLCLIRYALCVLARILGQLARVDEGRAQLAVGPLSVDVLIPGSDTDQLARRVGEEVEFHTLLVLEGVGQGTSMVPRLLGFSTVQDRAFFELFTTVKNIGHRKALRALQIPTADIAAAIARRDTATLVSLPEIGKRTAETIIAELSGKVDAYLDTATAVMAPGDTGAGSLLSDAIAMLVALGERPDTARQLAERAWSQNPEVESSESLLATIMATR